MLGISTGERTRSGMTQELLSDTLQMLPFVLITGSQPLGLEVQMMMMTTLMISLPLVTPCTVIVQILDLKLSTLSVLHETEQKLQTHRIIVMKTELQSPPHCRHQPPPPLLEHQRRQP